MIYSLTVYIFLIGGTPYKGNIFLCKQKLEKSHSKEMHDTSICLSLDKIAVILHKNQSTLSIVKIYASSSRAGKARPAGGITEFHKVNYRGCRLLYMFMVQIKT